MNSMMMTMKARLKAAGERAALPGESAKPYVIERSGGTATVGDKLSERYAQEP